jgi:hypothetical protein
VKIVGFGYTAWNASGSDRLLTASVSAIDTGECARRYGRPSGFFGESVTCTLGSGSTSCYGDSGGPLVDASERLVGITSFGTRCESRSVNQMRWLLADVAGRWPHPFYFCLPDCDPNNPSGSARLAAAMPWIAEAACGLSDFKSPYCTAPPTASPVRAPVPAPPVAPPAAPASEPARCAVSAQACADRIRRRCGCPGSAEARAACSGRVVRAVCCPAAGSATQAYIGQARRLYGRRRCGFTPWR